MALQINNQYYSFTRTEIPDDELRPILAGIPFFAEKASAAEASPSTSGGDAPDPEKRIRALRKKLEQIKRLKEMQKNGEKMQENQVTVFNFSSVFLCTRNIGKKMNVTEKNHETATHLAYDSCMVILKTSYGYFICLDQ